MLLQQLRPLGTDLQSQEDGAFAEPSASGEQIRDETPAVTVNSKTENDLKPVDAARRTANEQTQLIQKNGIHHNVTNVKSYSCIIKVKKSNIILLHYCKSQCYLAVVTSLAI